MICTYCKEELPEDKFDQKKVGNKLAGRLKKVCRKCCRHLGKVASANKRRDRELNAKGKDYLSRFLNLKRLGFANYREYLASELWQRVRSEVFRVKGRKCYLCGEHATEAHHNRYHENDLTGKRLKYIQPICRACHESIEFRAGEKATVAQAKTTFRKIRNARNKELRAG